MSGVEVSSRHRAAFVTVAETGQLTAAARRLHVSQPRCRADHLRAELVDDALQNGDRAPLARPGLGASLGSEGSAQLLSEAVEHGSQRVGNRALAQADGPPLVAEDQREVVLEAVGARRRLGFVIRRFERARKCLGLVGVEIELRGPP